LYDKLKDFDNYLNDKEKTLTEEANEFFSDKGFFLRWRAKDDVLAQDLE